MTASRLDLHADWQGLTLCGDDRHRFVARADARVLHEDADTFRGFEFGRRASGTICARIYDKTAQIKKSGAHYWYEIWGERFDKELPVIRVEFEIGREALRQFSVKTPLDAIEAASSIWRYCAGDWLTLRTPTGDRTRSRWPISPEWERVQAAQLSVDAHGIERIYAGRTRGELWKLLPPLIGMLARFAAVVGKGSLREAMAELLIWSARYEQDTEISFETRIASKARELGLA